MIARQLPFYVGEFFNFWPALSLWALQLQYFTSNFKNKSLLQLIGDNETN
jgi:hypothetical protein